MKTKKYWILVIVSFSILIVSAQQITGKTGLFAKDKKNDSNLTALHKSALSAKGVLADEKEVLQGLEGVWVLVGEIKQEVEKYGLTKKDIQTDTELQLRQYGIKVLTEEEWLSTPGLPLLSIIVSIKEDTPVSLATIAVQLREKVLLLREPKRICYGAYTWRRGGVSRGGLRRVKKIRGLVKDLVNEFINDYLAANPKESPVKEEEEKPKDD